MCIGCYKKGFIEEEKGYEMNLEDKDVMYAVGEKASGLDIKLSNVIEVDMYKDI